LADTELVDTELADTELADTELADTELADTDFEFACTEAKAAAIARVAVVALGSASAEAACGELEKLMAHEDWVMV
ncbi:hypothetical protein T492DRAFT_862358, partial [Pavlovales sp. CCMP2436]